LGETIRVAAELPVVFIKNAATGRFELVALLGFEPRQNLMLKAGSWSGFHVPKACRSYPLALIEDSQNPEQLLVALIESSPAVNALQGEALFNADGSDSEFLKAKTSLLTEVLHGLQHSKAFCQQLASLDLLQPQSLKVSIAGQEKNIQGLYIIDEQRLNQLTQTDFVLLREQNYLPAIYAHLMSLQQIQRLAGLAAV